MDLWNYVRDNIPAPAAFVTNGKGCATRKFGTYANHKQYCERLRLIMIQHIGKVSQMYSKFFVVTNTEGGGVNNGALHNAIEID